MKKIILNSLICLLFLAIALSSCNGNSESSALVMAVESNPKSLDPRVGNDSISARIHQLLFNSLVKKNERFEIIPNLATFEESPDHSTITFRLRPGVKFHNGRELTARDVKYTLDSILNGAVQSPYRGDFIKSDSLRVESVEARDPLTVVLRIRGHLPTLLTSLVPIGIIPEGMSNQDAAQKPVGTGPFKFVSQAEQQQIDLEAFDGYFENPPSIKRLRIRLIQDNAVRQLELKRGDIHLAVNTLFPPDVVEAMKSEPGLKVVITNGTNIDYIGVNVTDPILSKREVRQAIAYGIDREQIIREVWRGQARKAISILPPEQWAFEPDVKSYNHDVAKAKQLLDQAGYTDADSNGPQPRFTLTLKTSSNAFSRQIASNFQDQLKKIGIELKLESAEFATFQSQVIQGNFQLCYLRDIGANQHVDIFQNLYHSRSIPTAAKNYSEGRNRSRYRNPEIDRLIERAESTGNEMEQKELYRQIQKILAEDLPQIYLWHPSNVVIASNRVGNINIDPSGSFFFIRSLTFSEAPLKESSE